MAAQIDKYLKGHPAHADRSSIGSRSLGPRQSDYRFRKKKKHLPKSLPAWLSDTDAKKIGKKQRAVK